MRGKRVRRESKGRRIRKVKKIQGRGKGESKIEWRKSKQKSESKE